jgi:predicted RNA binding protein YcfA (HicA-like mRNA interferase family)
MSAKLPQIKGDRLVNVFKKLGWYIDRKSGGHVIMRHNSKPKIRVIIPIHSEPVKPGTLNNILKEAELSVEELKELM